MALTGCKKTWATKIMNDCRSKFGGSIVGRPNVITSKSFWKREGTTIEEELRLLSIAKYGKEV